MKYLTGQCNKILPLVIPLVDQWSSPCCSLLHELIVRAMNTEIFLNLDDHIMQDEATMHPHVYEVQISLILDLKAHFAQRLELTFK